jgi:hypothetical protein
MDRPELGPRISEEFSFLWARSRSADDCSDNHHLFHAGLLLIVGCSEESGVSGGAKSMAALTGCGSKTSVVVTRYEEILI